MSPTGPRWRSLSGLTTELTATISPPAISTRHRADQAAVGVEHQSAGEAVDRGAAHLAAAAGALAVPVGEGAGDATGSVQRPRQRRHLAAAVAAEDDVVGEQRLQRLEVAAARRRRRSGRRAPRGARSDPSKRGGAPRRGAAPAPRAARVVLALADDLGDLAVAVVEDVVEEEHRALLGRQALEQDQEGDRERVGHLDPAAGSARPARRRAAPAATRRRRSRAGPGPSAARRSPAG